MVLDEAGIRSHLQPSGKTKGDLIQNIKTSCRLNVWHQTESHWWSLQWAPSIHTANAGDISFDVTLPRCANIDTYNPSALLPPLQLLLQFSLGFSREILDASPT